MSGGTKSHSPSLPKFKSAHQAILAHLDAEVTAVCGGANAHALHASYALLRFCAVLEEMELTSLMRADTLPRLVAIHRRLVKDHPDEAQAACRTIEKLQARGHCALCTSCASANGGAHQCTGTGTARMGPASRPCQCVLCPRRAAA